VKSIYNINIKDLNQKILMKFLIRDCYEKTCNPLTDKDVHSFFDRCNIGPNLSDFVSNIFQGFAPKGLQPMNK
jgi:hypothetical protein